MGFRKKNATDREADKKLVAHAMQARAAANQQVAAMAPMAQGAMDMMRGMNMPEMMAYAAKLQRIQANPADGTGTITAARNVGPGSNGMGVTMEFDISVTAGPGAPRGVTVRQEMMGDVGYYQPGLELALRMNAADPSEAMIWGMPDATPAAPPASGMPPPGTPPGSPPGGGDTLARLEQLGQLRDAGAISPEEFEAQKTRILAGG
jgi:hypothetical protein